VIPDGTYRARFTADEFLAVGIGTQQSAEYMGTWTLVIDDGRFSFDLASDGPQYSPSTCDGSVDLVDGVVRFTFDGSAEDWCWPTMTSHGRPMGASSRRCSSLAARTHWTIATASPLGRAARPSYGPSAPIGITATPSGRV
jgi:hypothetical protein